MENYESDNDVFEDEDDEMSGSDENDHGSETNEFEVDESGGKGEKKGDPRYALPTPEEQRALRQTSDLLTSNILSMETTELLEEVKPKYKASMEGYLRELHEILMK